MFGLFESKQEKAEKLLKKGFSAMASGRFNSAEGYFLKAIGKDVFNAAEGWIALGILYASTGSLAKAKSCFETAMDQKKDDYHAIRGMALVEKRLGNDEHAAEMFGQLEKLFSYKPSEDPTLAAEDKDWFQDHNLWI